MSEYYTNKEDKIDFKQIALGHYKKILEITTNEFTGGYYNYTYNANSTTKQYVPDKRAEFTQAVESLAIALYPHFDKQMREDYQRHLNSVKQLTEKYSDKEGFIKSSEEGKIKLMYSIKMVELIKDLFRDLSCLMYRLDYFKTASYSEGDIQEIVDVDGGEIHKTKEEKEDD